jgi:predicted RNA-binding Zn ribbon-like protein
MPSRSSQTTDEVIPAPDDDLCLTFANTRYWRGSASPTEVLHDPDDLLRWAGTAERLPPPMIGRFSVHWRKHPNLAAASFTDAIDLRETIFCCVAATAAGRLPSAEDLTALNAALATTLPRQRLRPGGWEIGVPSLSVGALLAPTLWSAAELLVRTPLPRLRQCANPECGWLFLDNSKSGNRRWCSMSACGNRAKAHRHYLRQKSSR